MANKAEFSIVINGIKESISAVDSLNKQLDALEKRIEGLSKRNVNISTSGGGNAKALDEEAKMLQKIDELHQKVAASEKQEYQELLHAKEELKEYQTIAKSIAAQTNLNQGINNTKTMAGMKAQLHDIKAAMQTLDVDSDKFKELQQQANELNNKLKEIESGYGQFGRNVGNYANGVAEGMQKIVIRVGDTAREFNNAREASRTLNMELKNMALNGEQGTQAYKDLDEAVKQMNSTLKDVDKSSVAMDNLLDTMQGITALASMSQGISALFGIDDSAIEQSIQKMVALQNVLQGLETIRKQMQTQEGIGMILSKGNAAVDAFAANLLKVDKNAAAASKSVKMLSTAMKAVGGVAIAAAIIAITVALEKMKKKFEEVSKKADESAKYVEAGAQAYAKAKTEINLLISRVDSFKGSLSQEKKLVEDINKTLNTHYKSLAEVRKDKTNLIKTSEAYCKMLEQEAIVQAAAAQYAQAYAQAMANTARITYLNGQIQEGFLKGRSNAKMVKKVRELVDANKELQTLQDASQKVLEEAQKNAESIRNSFGFNQETKNSIKSGSKDVEKATEEAWKRINDSRLYLMKDGLAKDLRQIDISYREEAQAIKKGGVLVQEQLKLLDEKYAKQRKELFDKYSKELSLKETSAQIEELEQYADRAARALQKFNETKGRQPELLDENTFKNIKEFIQSDDWNTSILYDGLLAQMNNGVPDAKKHIIRLYNELFDETLSEEADNIEKEIDVIIDEIENRLYPSINLWRRYGNELIEAEAETQEGLNLSLKDGFIYRLDLQNKYYNDGEKEFENYNKNILAQQKEAINKQRELEQEAAKQQRDSLLQNEFDITSGMSKNQIAKIREDNKVISENNDKVREAFNAKIIAIDVEYQSKIEDAEKSYLERSRDRNKEYFDERLRIFEEFQQKYERKIQLQPEYNDWGTFNLKKTRENYEKAIDEARTLRGEIEEALSLNEKKRSQGLISDEDANIVKDNLNAMATSVDETLNYIEKRQKETWKEWWAGINQWIQQVGQAATQIINSIGDINQAAFERQLEAIEKQTEELEKQLDKQRELTQKYADDVDDIEDELSSSRGDRRQFLIDQLNAQMAAQRESLAQEKRIEKEQERLDKRREELEYQNEVRKWNQSKLTAAINAALAISAAAVNNWPIPAVPMMALATAVGAAQVAAVMANKPKKYAEGGVLQGSSHNQGGIKVLGGRAELEGGEYVTNKRTTAQNLPLLEFINNKKKRLDIDDMIDFYSSGIKKNISIPNKYKYADGGQLPTLRSDIDLEGNVLRAIEKYNERNIVVSVVDIINKSDNVKQVQTLAGL